jgi:ribosomal protein S18 acetylase RimI-like enzyme
MALVEQAFALAISRGATTMRLIANPEALSFYEKAGFVLKGETPTRFGPALLMQRQLSPVSVSGAARMRT